MPAISHEMITSKKKMEILEPSDHHKDQNDKKKMQDIDEQESNSINLMQIAMTKRTQSTPTPTELVLRQHVKSSSLTGQLTQLFQGHRRRLLVRKLVVEIRQIVCSTAGAGAAGPCFSSSAAAVHVEEVPHHAVAHEIDRLGRRWRRRHEESRRRRSGEELRNGGRHVGNRGGGAAVVLGEVEAGKSTVAGGGGVGGGASGLKLAVTVEEEG